MPRNPARETADHVQAAMAKTWNPSTPSAPIPQAGSRPQAPHVQLATANRSPVQLAGGPPVASHVSRAIATARGSTFAAQARHDGSGQEESMAPHVQHALALTGRAAQPRTEALTGAPSAPPGHSQKNTTCQPAFPSGVHSPTPQNANHLPIQLAVKRKSEAENSLEELLEMGEGIYLETDSCDKEAVCWNWVLYGGENAIEEDLREEPSGKGNLSTKREEEASRELEKAGLQEKKGSNLFVIFYFQPRSANPNHLEFIYRGENQSGKDTEVTISKGMDDDLYASKISSVGSSALKRTKRVEIEIDPDSLKGNHLKALKDLASKVAAKKPKKV